MGVSGPASAEGGTAYDMNMKRWIGFEDVGLTAYKERNIARIVRGIVQVCLSAKRLYCWSHDLVSRRFPLFRRPYDALLSEYTRLGLKSIDQPCLGAVSAGSIVLNPQHWIHQLSSSACAPCCCHLRGLKLKSNCQSRLLSLT